MYCLHEVWLLFWSLCLWVFWLFLFEWDKPRVSLTNATQWLTIWMRCLVQKLLITMSLWSYGWNRDKLNWSHLYFRDIMEKNCFNQWYLSCCSSTGVIVEEIWSWSLCLCLHFLNCMFLSIFFQYNFLIDHVTFLIRI